MIHTIINQLKDIWNQSNYQPLLEADVAGWLFHLFITTSDSIQALENLHLDTRVLNALNSKFDVVVGKYSYPDNQRACLDPRIVIEIKLFPSEGFNDSQQNVHFLHIINDDLKKLGSLPNTIQCRCSLIVDAAKYLRGKHNRQMRSEVIKTRRNEIAQGVDIYFLKYENTNWSYEKW